MLNKAVKSLKNGSEPDLMAPMKAVTDISLGIPALLPNDYCPDVHERLSLYKRLASSEDLENLNLINEELVDRFGPPPEAAEALLNTHRLRLNMTEIGLRKIDASTQGISLQFIPNPPIDPIKIIHLIQTNKHIQLNGQDRLKITPKSEGEFENSVKRIDVVKQLIAHLKSNPAPNK
jgi:transcription-repair coupling factor (superfamily II helicase)